MLLHYVTFVVHGGGGTRTRTRTRHSIDLIYQLLALKAGFFVPQKGHSIIGYVPEGNG